MAYFNHMKINALIVLMSWRPLWKRTIYKNIFDKHISRKLYVFNFLVYVSYRHILQ